MSSIFRVFSLFSLVLLFISCQVEPVESDVLQTKDPEGCETAFAMDKKEQCFIYEGFKRWGWRIGPIEEGTQISFPIYAAAGKCQTENGFYVGQLTISYFDGTLDVQYISDTEYEFFETHLYVGNEPYPTTPKGKPTVAPGQYGNQHELPGGSVSDTYKIDGLEGPIHIIAHAVVCPKK